MAHNEVLLLKPVDGLGAEGDQVKVRAGYARNFLLPRGFAYEATAGNRKRIADAARSAHAQGAQVLLSEELRAEHFSTDVGGR